MPAIRAIVTRLRSDGAANDTGTSPSLFISSLLHRMMLMASCANDIDRRIPC
jgi:hypothetical protein